ncbi:MAG: hypothetical protein NWE89_04890 [Candidatus Bathyarchaeota archaeon]|nr:hypothetical protein [Candidatus Bathyarchaeota archaeon]
MEKRVREIVLPAVIYVALLTAIVWFLLLQRTVVTVDFLGSPVEINLSILGVPLTSFITLYFCSIISERLLVGKMVKPLTEGFRRLAYASFIFFASDWGMMPGWAKPITGFLFYGIILSTLHKVLSQVVKEVNYIFEPILSSVYFLFIGFLGSYTWLEVYPFLEASIAGSPFVDVLMPFVRAGIVGPINNVIIASTALTAVVALTGVVKNHPNVYLRYVGRSLSNRLDQVTLLSFLLIYYAFFIRNFMFTLSGINTQYIVMGEWAIICLAFYFSYRSFQSYAEETLVTIDQTGTWKTHFQQINLNPDPKLELFSNLIEQFILHGDKEDLIIHLTLLLRNSDEGPLNITQIVSPIISYKDVPRPRLGFLWQADNIDRVNVTRRRKIINTVLSSIQLKPLNSQTEPKETEEEQALEVT